MECIVRFEVKHKEGSKRLRGLIFMGSEHKPSEDQLVEMFKDMKYNVNLADREKLVFTPVDPRADYTLIRVTELDTGEKKYVEDTDLKNVLSTLMPKRPTGL